MCERIEAKQRINHVQVHPASNAFQCLHVQEQNIHNPEMFSGEESFDGLHVSR